MRTLSKKVLLFLLLTAFILNLKADDVLASWSLSDGQGDVIQGTPKKYNGLIFGDDKAAPIWKEGELFFRGRSGYGGVKVLSGGNILQGPLFKISFEIKPVDKKSIGYLLTCKHYSRKDGGFSISYWGDKHTLTFNFGDGQKKHIYKVLVPGGIPAGKWNKISISYNGSELKFNINGKNIKTIEKSGLSISRNKMPLYIGAYTWERKNNFNNFEGGIRNISFSRPSSKNGNEKLITIKAKGSPKIDGKLNDAIWRKVPWHSNFVYYYEGKIANPQTSFALTCDNKNIYIAVRCFDKNMNRLKKTITKRDGPVCIDDSIDIFIDPDMSGDHCFQLELNAANVQNDAILTFFGNRRREDFNMKWLSAVDVKKDEWTAEIAIPFSELMIMPDNFGNWHFNICRACMTVEKNRYSTWGSLQKGEHSSGFKDFKLFRVVNGLTRPDFPNAIKKKIVALRNKWELNRKPPTAKNAIVPVHDIIYVANNMIVPNYFINNFYGNNLIKSDTSYVFDLPKGIELLHVGGLEAGAKYDANQGYYKWEKEKTVKHDGLEYIRYIIKPVQIHYSRKAIGPLYLKSSQKDGTLQKIFYFSRSNNGNQKMSNTALLTKKFPKPGMPKKIIACYAWLTLWTELSWPGIIDTLADLGFNTFPVHPPQGDTFSHEQILQLVHKARNKGMKILYLDSPFYSIRANTEGNSTDVKGMPKTDIKDACPAYRGKLYTDYLKKISDYASLLKPDYAQFDIEVFYHGALRGRTKQCQRCAAYIKKSGKPTKEAMCNLGTQIMGDIKKSLATGIRKHKLPAPMNGNYHTKPGGFIYDGVFNFDKMSQAGVAQSCHPVYYSSSFANVSGENLRKLKKMVKDNKYIIPWSTTGYAGVEYPVEWVYDYVLELYASGANGIYWFSPFIEGADLYYYAKAMESINPVSELIYTAKPLDEIKVNDAKFNVTGLRNKKEYLLLVSSYTENPSGMVEISLPVNISGKIWDIAREKQIGMVKNSRAVINFMPGCKGAHTAIYYIGNKRKFNTSNK